MGTQLLPIFTGLYRLMNRLDIQGTQLNESCVIEIVLILSVGNVQRHADELPICPFIYL
jgi:hypothetical protein